MLYWGKLEKYKPTHSIVLDLVVDERDFSYGWRWLVQSNHVSSTNFQMPAGGNVVSADGGGVWLPFSWNNTADWEMNSTWGRERYPKGSGSVNRDNPNFWTVTGSYPSGAKWGAVTY